MVYKKSPFLKKNDKVALIATAKVFAKKDLSPALALLKNWGLEVVLGPNCYAASHQFAGTDEQRKSDLQWALDDSKIRAIFCIRGGYGTNRIIDGINVEKFSKSPKWVVGFSDVTILHAALQKNAYQSIHGPMPIQFGTKAYKNSLTALKDTLFGKVQTYKVKAHPLNRLGDAQGVLMGGNLSILCSMIGTASALDTNKAILFIEDVGEDLYRLDRMMIHLKRSGWLKSLSGLIVGHFTAMEDGIPNFGKSSYEIIQEATQEYQYPVCFDFPAGHEPDNMPLIFGKKVQLKVRKGTTTLVV